MWVFPLKQKMAIYGRQAKGALLLGLFLSVVAMALSAKLHQAIHDDASNTDHQCAVTLLVSGQVDASANLVNTASQAPAIPIDFSFPDEPLLAGISFHLPPGRGPPALLS
jgi:hypothetical protein